MNAITKIYLAFLKDPILEIKATLLNTTKTWATSLPADGSKIPYIFLFKEFHFIIIFLT